MRVECFEQLCGLCHSVQVSAIRSPAIKAYLGTWRSTHVQYLQVKEWVNE